MAKRKQKRIVIQMPTDVSTEQFDMMKHAFGFDSKQPGFRTHYCTDVDDSNMIHLVESGYFVGPRGVGLYGSNCGMFYLTEKSKAILSGEDGTRS